MFKPYLLFVLLFMLPFFSAGQPALKDSTYHYPEQDKLLKHFHEVVGDESRLYNGNEYLGYSTTIKGNAYFLDSATPINGLVEYDGITYANVPLVYDLNADLIISFLPDNATPFSLLKERVRKFVIAGHTFINISADTLSTPAELRSGFYDAMYVGGVSFLLRHVKTIQQNMNSQNLQSYFEPKDYYYIQKDRHYYAVSSQRSVLKVFKDHKKELQRYLKDNKIKFRTNPEQSIMLLTAYYDRLTK